MIQPLHSWITPSLAAALDLPRLRATPLHLWDWFFPGTSRLAAEVDDKQEPKMKWVAALKIIDDDDDDDDDAAAAAAAAAAGVRDQKTIFPCLGV